jgi:hypothetical protein
MVKEHDIMQTDSKDIHFASAPDGKFLIIPRELYVAITDFLQTRKQSGSITVQFRGGEITCVEAMSRKTFKQL